eukprot:349953-Chlamydomonas_euryale.AAC.1
MQKDLSPSGRLPSSTLHAAVPTPCPRHGTKPGMLLAACTLRLPRRSLGRRCSTGGMSILIAGYGRHSAVNVLMRSVSFEAARQRIELMGSRVRLGIGELGPQQTQPPQPQPEAAPVPVPFTPAVHSATVAMTLIAKLQASPVSGATVADEPVLTAVGGDVAEPDVVHDNAAFDGGSVASYGNSDGNANGDELDAMEEDERSRRQESGGHKRTAAAVAGADGRSARRPTPAGLRPPDGNSHRRGGGRTGRCHGHRRAPRGDGDCCRPPPGCGGGCRALRDGGGSCCAPRGCGSDRRAPPPAVTADVAPPEAAAGCGYDGGGCCAPPPPAAVAEAAAQAPAAGDGAANPDMVLTHRARACRRAKNRQATSLRVATHIVAGILGGTGDGKLEQLLDLWFRQLRLHVVLIQETHITSQREVQCSEVESRATSWLQSVGVRHGLEWMWAPARFGVNSHGETAIVVRSDLISTERLNIIGSRVALADGRLIYVGVRWAGHDFNLASAYLPSGVSGESLNPCSEQGASLYMCAKQLAHTNPELPPGQTGLLFRSL